MDAARRSRDAEGLSTSVRSCWCPPTAQFRDFDERWLRLVEPLRAFRFVYVAAWVARRWKEPQFRSAYPHFGTEHYWEDETRDLEEQVERLGSDG